MDLVRAFSSVTDPRRAQGQRVSLEQVLIMSILSYLCGHSGYRGISRFSKAYSDSLTGVLGLKHAVPSHVTFFDVLSRVDQQQVIDAFNSWAGSFAPLEDIPSGIVRSLMLKIISNLKNGKPLIDSKKQLTSQAERSYISDLSHSDAGFFFKGIRGHWQIENNLHWVKDVIHNEDKNRISKANGPVNMAVISSIDINLGRKYGQWSMTENSVRFDDNIEKAMQIIRN